MSSDRRDGLMRAAKAADVLQAREQDGGGVPAGCGQIGRKSLDAGREGDVLGGGSPETPVPEPMLRAASLIALFAILFRLLPRRTAGERAPMDFLRRQGADDRAKDRTVCREGGGRQSMIRKEKRDAQPSLRRLRDPRYPGRLPGRSLIFRRPSSGGLPRGNDGPSGRRIPH